MNIFRRPLPIRIIRRLERHPVMVVTVATLGVRFGRDAWRLRGGEIDPAEFRKRAGGHLGTVGGGVAGAAAGAAAGSVVPGLGTIIGAFCGGMLGETLGGKVGRRTAENLETLFEAKREADEAPDLGMPKRSL